jgi:hypothetical protein
MVGDNFDRLKAAQALLDNGMQCSELDIEHVLNAFDCIPTRLQLGSELHPDLASLQTELDSSPALKCTL